MTDRGKGRVAGNGCATGDSRQKRLGGCTGKGFMPGQSGNPKGSYRKRLLDEALEQELEAGGSEAAGVIARALIRKARSGDTRAAQLVAERTQGKPKQKLDVGLSTNLGALSDEEVEKRLLETVLELAQSDPELAAQLRLRLA